MANEMVVLTNPLRAGGPSSKLYDDVVCVVDNVFNSLPEGAAKTAFDASVRQPTKTTFKDLMTNAYRICSECIPTTGTPSNEAMQTCFAATHAVNCELASIWTRTEAWLKAHSNDCSQYATQLGTAFNRLYKSIQKESNDVLASLPLRTGGSIAASNGKMPWGWVLGIGGGAILLIMVAGAVWGKKKRKS